MSCGCLRVDNAKAMSEKYAGKNWTQEQIEKLWELKLLGLQLDEALS